MTMHIGDPPIAEAIFTNGHIVANADLFEKFAVHYSRIIRNNKKIIREYLKHNTPRRSSRLAQKRMSLDQTPIRNKRSRKMYRSNSLFSEATPEAVIPVMRLSELKRRRYMEIVSSELKRKPVLPVEDPDIIEIKDDESEEEYDSGACDILQDFENNNFNGDENVQIRIEDESCSPPIQIDPPMEEEYYEQVTYMHPGMNQNYMYVSNHNINPNNQMYAQQMPYGMGAQSPQSTFTSAGPSYQQYMPQSFPPPNSSMPYMSSVRPPSLTPDSPMFSPYPEPTQFLPNGTVPPYNCKFSVNQMLPMVDANGKKVCLGNFTLFYGNFQVEMQGTLNFNSAFECFLFESYFLNPFANPAYVFDPNANRTANYAYAEPQQHIPEPTPEPEPMTQTESIPQMGQYQHLRMFNAVPHESGAIRLNNIQNDGQKQNECLSASEDTSSSTKIEIMEMDDSTDEEEYTTAAAENRWQERRCQPSSLEINLNAYPCLVVQPPLRGILLSQQFRIHSYFRRTSCNSRGCDLRKVQTTRRSKRKIHLRTDLIHFVTFTGHLVEFHKSILYVKHFIKAHPGYFIVYDGTLFVGDAALYFSYNIPYFLGIKERMQLEEINY